MRVLLVGASSARRGRFARVLSDAAHEVREADDPEAGLRAAREWLPAVAVVHAASAGAFVGALKADPDAYGTAVLVIERAGLTPAEAREGMRRGVQDYLIEPVAEGEVLTRVEAAARTQALQHELVTQSTRLESLLREDALTGLWNRRAILAALSGMVSAARRHGRPLSIAVLDLDDFKRVNDTHGHTHGDAVLVEAARILRSRLRAEDQIGRLGGEEFVVLLPDADARAARLVAEKLRAGVAAAPVAVTVSIGVATWNGESAEELLQRADTALYAAKDAGRDRVMAATLHGRT
ncbi:MAG TPA: GGDEF domain-containing protein [Solirubrobacter sp.]|nr:GGDEF domain-containing protein [Solirubrobacter sp.]